MMENVRSLVARILIVPNEKFSAKFRSCDGVKSRSKFVVCLSSKQQELSASHSQSSTDTTKTTLLRLLQRVLKHHKQSN